MISFDMETWKALGSPTYVFDLDAFAARCRRVKEFLGKAIPLTYSMKANPFLLYRIPDEIRHIEVCSPGELFICRQRQILPENIIYSGVTKEARDVEDAVRYGVDILTAESILHVELENEAVMKLRHSREEKRKVLLRLTSGNQFGMSEEDIEWIIAHRDRYPALEFYGIHHYSGTQKKMRQIGKDLKRLDNLCSMLLERYGYEPTLIEYGPGACVDYFEEPHNETDWKHFAEVAALLQDFAAKYPTGIEMGRFLAADCGHYLTQIKDSKVNQETNYLICDGGIHHLKYYGQTMAMQIPPIDVFRQELTTGEWGSALRKTGETETEKIPYMICGSLCTTADILVREVELPQMQIGDYLLFHRCGAYSMTEGSALFLSRTMPRIYVWTESGGMKLLRDFVETAALNGGRIWTDKS